MVRLKVDVQNLTITVVSFQFHNGSIKRKLPPAPPAVLTNFNSTMVRLKVVLLGLLRPILLHFNSTMVRLKEDFPDQATAIAKFQFHNGSIKRLSEASLPSGCNAFQFHNGSIKRCEYFQKVVSCIEFQFHNGSIKRQCGRFVSVCQQDFNSTMVRLKAAIVLRHMYPRLISIPQWFD